MCENFDLFFFYFSWLEFLDDSFFLLKGLIIIPRGGELPNENVEDTRRVA